MTPDPRADEPEISSDPHDYAGRHEHVPGCCYLIGYWKNAQCGDPRHGTGPHCFTHSVEVSRRMLAEAIKAIDAERIGLYTDDLAELLGVEEMVLAA